MRVVPANIILQKNKIDTASAWIWLIDLSLTTDVLYFASNTENITFQGTEYTAFNFELDALKDDKAGSIETLVVKFNNVGRTLETYLEDLDGAIGSTVSVKLVNNEYLADGTAFERVYDVVASEADPIWVTLQLGAPNPISKRFPLWRYIAEHCNFPFKGVECTYAGTETTCGKTLTDCQNYSNSTRFGGYPGMGSGGIKVV